YPIQLVGLEGQRALLAGGGPVAAEKIVPLIHAGARVHLVTPEVSAEMDPWLSEVWKLERRPVRDEDVPGARVVLAATDDSAANRRLVRVARAHGILAQAADDKPFCDFYSPAVVRRGSVMMTISTDGGSPLLAGQLRRLLEAAIPRSLVEVSDLMVRLRDRGLRGLERRGRLLRALADPTISRLVDRGDTEAAEARLEALFHEEEEPFEAGSVAIVGAGPGSRELLTLRALDRIQRADVILHDALVEPEVLALALPGTEVVDVGRRARSVAPDAASADELRIPLMLEAARSGKRVVRLHAGDPFVFGRGGEEVDALVGAGIAWEVVPGVSSVTAAPAAAGIPLTQRGLAKGFTVRTGHDAGGGTRGELSPEDETVVVLMGLGSAEDVLEGLAAEGRTRDTPAAAVSRASVEGERLVTGTLGTLASRIREEGLESPATIIVGEVARRAVEAEADRRTPEGPAARHPKGAADPGASCGDEGSEEVA
ncbi:MAG TPA: uroporphyrinogen-III C-methyltransferase, partial [Longimicrobiales bacterium]|nr:uroporphyrinogen-III C-methyltransferase [Longimicrobiales bacterium]